MSTCTDKKNKSSFSKAEDIDLEALINDSQSNESASKDSFINDSSGEGETLILHESNESLNEEDISQSKPSFFDKSFLKSLPVAILAKRKIFGSNSELSPSVTNSLTRSSSGTPRVRRAAGSLSSKKADRLSACKTTETGMKQVMWNIWVSDKATWEEVAIPRNTSCAVLLHLLLSQLQRFPDLTQWSIIEQNSETMIERFVEDFELMKEVVANRDFNDNISRLCLNRAPGKYLILERPEQCIPEDMLTYTAGKPPWHNETLPMEKRSQIKDLLTKKAPEMCGWLSLREIGKKSWKKFYCVLRNSGFYYSTKDSSKEAENLVCISEIHSSVVWFPFGNKMKFGYTPTPHVFCLKPRNSQTVSDTRWFCADSSQLKVAWINALRLTLNGNRYHESYLNARNFDPTNLIRSAGNKALNKSDDNFAPMDFGESSGKVIHDPSEVAATSVQKKSSWRKRLRSRSSKAAVHTAQSWFYGKISREFAAREIQRHGSLDGTFLLRESQTISGSVVITICHSQKPRHIPITQIERDGLTYYTCDNGETRFLDLIQLVDFHRLNKGALPCTLQHECTKNY